MNRAIANTVNRRDGSRRPLLKSLRQSCARAFFAGFAAVMMFVFCGELQKAGATIAGGDAAAPSFISETRKAWADIRSAPGQFGDGGFVVRADTNVAFDDAYIDTYNPSLKMMRLGANGRSIHSFLRTPMGRGFVLAGRRDFWSFTSPVGLKRDQVAVAGWTAGVADGTKIGRAIVVFNGKTGRLDAKFGKRGVLIDRHRSLPSGSRFWRPSNLIAGGDSRLIECGYKSLGGLRGFPYNVSYVRMLNSSGRATSGFGTSGYVYEPPPVGMESSKCSTSTLDGSDRILVAGLDRESGGKGIHLWVRRYSSAGTLDQSYGANGKFSMQNAPDSPYKRLLTATKIIPLADGSVVVAADISSADEPHDSVVFKLTPSGELDSTFAAGGAVLPARLDDANVDSEGRVLLSGFALTSGLDRLYMARLLPSGILDVTFFGSGMREISGNVVGPTAIFALPNGRMRVWGVDLLKASKPKRGKYNTALRTQQRMRVISTTSALGSAITASRLSKSGELSLKGVAAGPAGVERVEVSVVAGSNPFVQPSEWVTVTGTNLWEVGFTALASPSYVVFSRAVGPGGKIEQDFSMVTGNETVVSKSATK